MSREKSDDKASSSNIVSDATGQHDARFLLWRAFCAENSVPVETLPSELEGEMRKRWEQWKDKQLHEAAEQKSTPSASS